MIKRTALPLVVLALAAAPASAADAGGGLVLGLRGHVPVVCRAQVEWAPAAPEAASRAGTLAAFCNSGEGYEIWADHAPGSQQATVLVDGRAVSLSSEGATRLLEASGPASTRHEVKLASGETAFTVRIRPR